MEGIKMIKQKQLNRWLWKWHIVGGLISLPFIFLLSVTGAIYLFKADFNNAYYEKIKTIEVPVNADVRPYSEQIDAVHSVMDEHISQVFIPESKQEATRFRVHSKGHARDMFYVDPYTSTVTGRIQQKETLMYKVRKMHGELLLSQFGGYVVELIASWTIVLIITGVYIWWPTKRFSMAGFFTIRTKNGKRIFWRDVHSVVGFWASIFLLIILAGGMPWTSVFGEQLKWVQSQTDTGYPKYWRSPKDLKSPSMSKSSQHNSETLRSLSLDEVVKVAINQNLNGDLTIKLPKGRSGVYSVSNRTFLLRDQKVFHLDQYTGEVIKSYNWNDVGILMEIRQVAMRLHQGEYGLINWLIVLMVSLSFAISAVAGLTSYLLRKPTGKWGFPVVPEQFKIGKAIFFSIIFLGVLFPLFGLTLLILSGSLLIKRFASCKDKMHKTV
jgi:uncharacterized iron-regulated membrane protein